MKTITKLIHSVFAVVTLAVMGLLVQAASSYPDSGTWTATGSLNTARYSHTATLLPNGKVLVAGGFNTSIFLTNAELYDPASGSWTATGSLNTARYVHTATLLPNGKVLVAGGFNTSLELTSAELYDPTSGSWTPTGNLTTARQFHTATLLPNGKVLVAGGFGKGVPLTSAELYEPTPGLITLSAAKRKVGGINTVRLTWSGATSANIDVYRDGVVIVTTANDGTHTDSTGDTGRAQYRYRVCEAGTATCSNVVRVRFPQ